MNHLLKIWMGCFLIISVSPTIDAHIISKSTYFQVTLDDNIIPISMGSIDIDGMIYGIEAKSFINLSSYQDILDDPVITNLFDTSILKNPYILPITGEAYFNDIDKVTIINIDLLNDIANKDSITLDDIQKIIDNTTIFYNIDIQTEKTIFGINSRGIKINQHYKYGLSSIISTILIDNLEAPILGIISNVSTSLRYLGNTSLILPLSNNSMIKILDQDNREIWNKTNSNTILLIEDDNLYFIEKPGILPVSSPSALTIRITPSRENIDPMTLLNQIPSRYLEDIHIPSSYYKMLFKISSIFNGALIIIDEDGGSVIIGNDIQEYHSFIVMRNEEYTISINEFSNKIYGYGKLFFLGNHFYNSQAVDDPNGIGFLYLPFLLWIIAIVFYIIKRKMPSRNKGYNIDRKFKIPIILLHIISIIITFILSDQEINYQLGVSLLSSITSPSIITGALAVLQTIIWILGYIFCSIPVIIIINSILHYVDIPNKHISKSIGILFIWIFAALYTTMILNVFLLFIPLPL